MVAILSRLRAAAIGFAKPEVVDRGHLGLDLDENAKAIADLKIDVANAVAKIDETARFTASSAFEASCRAVLATEKARERSGSSYADGIEDAAVAVSKAKYRFLAELDGLRNVVPFVPRPDGSPRRGGVR